MKRYVRIFNEIKNNNSRLVKEALLKDYAKVEGFQDILKFIYDPMIVTGLAKRKIEKKVSCIVDTDIDLKDIFEAMEFVKDNCTGNDTVIKTIQDFLETLDTIDEKELAKSILIKDLPIGISRTTLNKVYGNDFIHKYSVQLASRYESGKKQFEGPFVLTLKIDGNRTTAFTFESGTKFFTRAGKEIEGLDDLKKEFDKLPKNMAYDGEIVAVNYDNVKSKDLFRITQTILRKKGEKKDLTFIMFDMLPISEFNKGISKKVYAERMSDIDMMFLQHLDEYSLIKQVPKFYIGADKNRIPEILTSVEDAGFEGLMINTLEGKYETKRSKNLLKVKTFNTVDLRCIGVKEDIRGGRCGSLIVEYKGYRVDVAGLKDFEKQLYWNRPELVIGTIIEVKYFEESTNANGGISLRFPTFIRIRDDKNEVSYS